MKFSALKEGDCGGLCSILITAVSVINCLLFSTTLARQLDLKDTCSGSSLYYCTLSNLTNTFEGPLVWINNSTADQLNELLIYDSVLGRLPYVLFEIAPKLHTLIVHNCAINILMPQTFQKAEQLHKLVLQKNRLFNIPERIFAGCNALEELYLSHNTINMIHQNAFEGLKGLKYLDLQENGIRTLPYTAFDDLINVEHIDLSFNEIEVIRVETFANNPKLKTLLLSENKFSAFESDALMHLNHMHTLDLSNTFVEYLQVQSVDVLLVPGSKLKYCEILGSVVKLNAANNDLHNITIRDKMSIRELELHGNRFESLQDIVGMLNLQKLDISKNQLTSLKTSQSPLYLPLPNLETLNLASNRLQDLSRDNFIFLVKLKSLDLAFNHLLRLESYIFHPLLNLEKFYIEGNRLFEFHYMDFKESHPYLREMGVFENDWEFRYLKNMLKYLRNHDIHLPTRFTPAHSSHSSEGSAFQESAEFSLPKSTTSSSTSDVDFLNDMNHARQSAHHQTPSAGVDGIHPYWTTRDVLSLITLIIVLIILLLQFFRILQEEHCLPNWCRCWAGLDFNRETEPLRNRHRPLVEDTSTV